MFFKTGTRQMAIVSWFALSLFAAVQLGLPAAAVAQAAGKVALPVGTVVDLTFDTAVTPNTAAVGQAVTMKVANDVKVNGKVVIPAGAAATGEVVQSSKAGAIGKEASISVTVKQVTAIDGTPVPLSGTKAMVGDSHQTSSIVITLVCCILGLLQQGGKAEIPAGATLRATVAAPVEIQVP